METDLWDHPSGPTLVETPGGKEHTGRLMVETNCREEGVPFFEFRFGVRTRVRDTSVGLLLLTPKPTGIRIVVVLLVFDPRRE